MPDSKTMPSPRKRTAKREPAGKLAPVATSELGVAGLRSYGGYLQEEFLRDLAGPKGVSKFREMADNDATIGAVLRAIELVLRRVEWEAEAADDSEHAMLEAEFALSLMDDMSHTWRDLIAEALSMLVYGWHYAEIVLKRRVGPFETDPSRRSKYTDGLIGLRKLAPRPQDTLSKWEIQPDGGIAGMWQTADPASFGGRDDVLIPIDRAILFRTTSRKNSPEGVSLLRNAYRAWYLLKHCEDVEAVGIDRELTGLPVGYVPSELLKSEDPKDKAIVAAFVKILRDVKFNEQGAILMSSTPYMLKDGTPTGIRQMSMELMTSGGQRAINPDITIRRHQETIARSVLAQFLMLGSSSAGSFALSEDASGFFMLACEAILDAIEEPLNRFLLPRIWDLNGKDRSTLPRFKHAKVKPVDLAKIGGFLRDAAGAGYLLGPDRNVEAALHDMAGLPPPDTAGGGFGST